jgi:flagellar hook assembly protein FlgD
VDLSVYDVCGRLVRTLERGSMSAGTGEVVWDGTDRNGRRVGAGVYFCRLRAEGRTLTKRMTRIE